MRLGRDGSGTVAVTLHVDAEVQERIGDLSTSVKTDDLSARGWTVSTPVTTGRTTSMTATKPFGSPAGLTQVMEEISGGSKLLDEWRVTVTDGFASTSWAVNGNVAATGDLAQFSDDSLAAALDGLPLGRTPEELAAEWGGTPPSLPVTFRVHLPDGTTQVRRVDVAAGRPTAAVISVDASERAAGPWLWLGIAGLATAVGVAMLVLARRESGRVVT